MQYMYDIRDMLCRELSDISKKGELTAGSLDTVDKITHAIKSIDTILAMDNYSEDHDASYRKDYSRGSYDRHRDTLGRYSSERYSNGRYSREAKEGMIHELHELMEDAPDEKTKNEFHKFITKLDSMR